MHKTLFKLLPLALASALTGCVSLTPPPATTHFETQSTTTRAQKLKAIRRWNIQGAMSVRQKSKAHIANFSWQLQSKHHYQIRLSSTLNVYNLLIKSTGQHLTLNQNKKQPITATSPRELMQKAVGFSLPISNLYYWVRGLAAPGKNQATFNQYGLLSRLQQQGWRIQYLRFKKINKVDLPQLIQLTRNDLSIRLVLKKWGIK